jgi:hypothetical protein
MTGPNNYRMTDGTFDCRTALQRERELRVAAERNAMRFHALLIRARVDLIRAQKAAA